MSPWAEMQCVLCVWLPLPFTCTNSYKPSLPPPPSKLTYIMAQPALFCPDFLFLSRRTNRVLLSHHLSSLCLIHLRLTQLEFCWPCHPPPARPNLLYVYSSALLTPTTLFVKTLLTKSCMLFFQPLHFLFVKVDVTLLVIINILFVWFVWFLFCFGFFLLFGRMQHTGEC